MTMMMRMMRIASVVLLSVDDVRRYGLPVVHQARPRHAIEHRPRPVGHVAELGRAVVLEISIF